MRRCGLEGWVAVGSWGMVAGEESGFLGVGAGKGFGVPGLWAFSCVCFLKRQRRDKKLAFGQQ